MIGGLGSSGVPNLIRNRAAVLNPNNPDLNADLIKPQAGVSSFPTTDKTPATTSTAGVNPKGPRGIGQYLSWEECNYVKGDYNGIILGSGGLPWQAPSWWEGDGHGDYQLGFPVNQQQSLKCINTIRESTTVTVTERKTKGCDAGNVPQACMNYRSVAKNMALFGVNPGNRDELYCPYVAPADSIPRYAPRGWNSQHHSSWISWVPQRQIDPRHKCQRDEYPFFRFLGAPNNDVLQWIRL
jgi:hypothetical protein